ncbi:hypothetical protein COBT_001132 [Conglomerata obtusa]
MRNHILNPSVFQSNEFIMLLRGETSIDRPVFRKYFPVVITNAEIETPEESVIDASASPNESIIIEELFNNLNRSSVCDIDSSSELSIEPRFIQGFETNFVINKSVLNINDEKIKNVGSGYANVILPNVSSCTKLKHDAIFDAKDDVERKLMPKLRMQRKIERIFKNSLKLSICKFFENKNINTKGLKTIMKNLPVLVIILVLLKRILM